MTFRQLVASILIVLLAGQSVAAAVDVHVQSAGEHQSETHSHDAEAQLLAETLLHELVDAVSDHELTHEETTESSLDCQHCCHCHNGGHALASILRLPSILPLSRAAPAYRSEPDSLLYAPDLRPPIV